MLRISLVLCGLVLIVSGQVGAQVRDPVSSYGLCDITYLELGLGDSILISVTNKTENPKPNRPCLLNLKACSSCRISLSRVGDNNFNFFCKTGYQSLTTCNAGCDTLYAFDKFYMNESKQFYTEWKQFNFHSLSSSIFIGFCHSNSDRYNFTFNATALSNSQTIQGTSQSEGFIMSPLFNIGSYSQNHETYEYIFTSMSDNLYILLTFSDWHLAPSSSMYFENSNIQNRITGTSFRPMVLSNSNKMMVKFHTGSSLPADHPRNYLGFRAKYKFIQDRNIPLPSTLCDGSGYDLNSSGGSMKFSSSYHNSNYLDCIWVWKRQPQFTGIIMRVIKFRTNPAAMTNNNTITIHDGLTSEDTVINTFDALSNINKGLQIRGTKGFYIQLKTLNEIEILQISYASINDNKVCGRLPGMFSCGDYCINTTLRCDGISHCKDNSDETTHCGEFTGQWDKSYEYTLTIGVIVPMVISVFLIMVLCFLFIMIRRCRHARMLQQRDGSVEHLGTVSEDVSSRRGRRRRRRRRNQMPSMERDMPPTYNEAMENPPGWYINVAFGNPADPSLPSPPPYTEVAEEYAAPQTTNQVTPGSPTSTDSSQSEVTICSRNQSGSSSSSEDDGDRWDNVRRDGRHGRLSRHLSSSDSDPEGGFAPISASVTQNTLLSTESLAPSQGTSSPRSGLEANPDKTNPVRRPENQNSKEMNRRKEHKKTNSADDCVVPDRDKPRTDGTGMFIAESVNGASGAVTAGSHPRAGTQDRTRRGHEPGTRMPPSSSRSVSTESDSSLGLSYIGRRPREPNSGRGGNILGPRSGQEPVSGNGPRREITDPRGIRLEPLSAETLYRQATNQSNPQTRSASQLPSNGYGTIVNVDNDEIIVPAELAQSTQSLAAPSTGRAPKLSSAVSMDTIAPRRGQMNKDAKQKSQSEYNLNRYGLERFDRESVENSRRHDRYGPSAGALVERQNYEDDIVMNSRVDEGGARFISLARQDEEDSEDIYV